MDPHTQDNAARIAPTNSLVGPLLTDMYQISMAYAYWKAGRQNDSAVFDLFFRNPPFGGEYCIFAGLDEVLKFVSSFKFSASDVEYLRTLLPHCEDGFFEFLLRLDCSEVKIYAVPDGTVVFPKIPLLRVEGPLAVSQLLETTLLNLTNFPSLLATNAARMRLAAGPNTKLLEFGLRRAQGPDGALSASKYVYVGGFDGTSNVLAGKLTGISVSGTHAHSFVMSYRSFEDIKDGQLVVADGSKKVDFVAMVLAARAEMGAGSTNNGELAAFTAYALAFPSATLCLVDTYDTLSSGLINFMVVGLALHRAGYKPIGIRLDSGDLAYLSRAARAKFRSTDASLRAKGLLAEDVFSRSTIVASNDINEDVLLALNREGHEIDCFGIGTHLVTCQKQPALGCVFKLVQINGVPRIKLSQEMWKLVIPCRKEVYRLFGKDGHPIVDLMVASHEPAPVAGARLLCRHPFMENLRAYVTPSRVERLLQLVWDGKVPDEADRLVQLSDLPRSHSSGALNAAAASSSSAPMPPPAATRARTESATVLSTLDVSRARCKQQLAGMRNDHIRPLNPTPYKVSVSVSLFEYLHQLWQEEAPVPDLC